MLSANQNAEIFVSILLTLKPMYTPVLDGYQLRTFHTTHDGITFRFPLPKRPYSFNMNRLYAAFLIFCVLLSKWSFVMLDLTNIRCSCRMLGCKQSLQNRRVNVMQFFFVQHTFSISLVISLQWPHLHQSGTGSAGCLGLSIVGSLSGNVSPSSGLTWISCATERNCSATSEGPGISLALNGVIGEPYAFAEGPL